ncbi:hypothetical protein CDD83_1714 [Cordyceps sp. RAO-2017]|nr:hypothetical protein CDD83_1714 [Cordyceps sp. RAO-2017]
MTPLPGSPFNHERTVPLNVPLPSNVDGAMTNYVYPPLNKGHIRLLTLYPGRKDPQLRAVLGQSPLLCADSFQTMSYTWRSIKLPHSLSTPEDKIKITASLHAALSSLRHEKEVLNLWVDAVCIDQNNYIEKMKQIQLLPRVFQRAACVLSSIAHDRFFSLLELAIGGNNEDFVIDYHANFDAIVRQYGWAFVHQGKVMELLRRAGISSRVAGRFPSWIPDWTAVKQDSLRSLARWDMPCTASPRTEPELEFNYVFNNFVLRVQGMRVDTDSNIPEELNAYLREVDSMLSPYKSRRGELKWKVPIAGAVKCRAVGLDMKESYAALRRHLTRKAKGSSDETAGEKAVSLLNQGQNYLDALRGNLVGWKFVVTDRGYVGITPGKAQPDDVLAILDGRVVPFALRRFNGSEGSFLLVEECYIHGLMNGEESKLGLREEMIALR